MEVYGEMAVRVPDDSSVGQRGWSEARFFEELPGGGTRGSLTRLDFSARKLPKSAQQSVIGPTMHQEPTPGDSDNDGAPHMRSGPTPPSHGNLTRLCEVSSCLAKSCDRALRASRVSRKADGFAEFHHGLGKRSGRSSCCLGVPPPLETVSDAPAVERAFFQGQSGRHPGSVRFEGKYRNSEGDGGDRVRDVPTDTGQGLELLGRSR